MVEELVDALSDSGAVAAAVVQVDADGAREVAFVRGAGDATDAHLFEIGSVTKAITGTVLGALVAGGDADLDAPIGPWLGHLPPGTYAASITIGQLATHTAGLPRLPANLEPEDRNDPYRHYTVAMALDALAALDGPGENQYSNFGFQVLGVVLERITGLAYGELVARHVFGPAGMTTACVRGAADDDRRLIGHASGKPVPHWNQQLPGAGGIDASADDMAAFVAAAVSGVRGEGALADAVGIASAASAQGASLGWQLANGYVWHNGGTGGFSAECAASVDGGLVVLVADSSVLDVTTALRRAWAAGVRGDELLALTRADPVVRTVLDSVIEDFAAGRFDALHSRLAPGFAAKVGAGALASAWNDTGGGLAGVSERRVRGRTGSARLAREDGSLSELVVHVGGDGSVVGMNLR